jgi:Flp pilus assembly protein TadD
MPISSLDGVPFPRRFQRSLIGGTLLLAFCATLRAASPCLPPPELAAHLQSDSSATVHADVGAWFHSQRQYQCAAMEFAIASGIQPDSGRLAYLWGLNLYSAGNEQAAVAPLKTAGRLSPTEAQPHLLLGAIFDHASKRAEAEAEWRTALALDPKAANAQAITALDVLAQDLLLDKEYEAVITLLTEPSKGTQRTPSQYLALGTAYARTNQLETALSVLQEGFHAAPDSAALASELADVLAILEKPQEAIQPLELALEKNPGNLSLRVLYLRILVSAQSPKALETGQQTLALAPQNAEALYLTGLAAKQSDQVDHARSYLRQSLAVNDASAKAHFELGQIETQLGDFQSAAEHLKKAIRLGDKEPGVEYALAIALRNLGQTEQAKAHLKLYEQQRKEETDKQNSAREARQAEQAIAAGDTTQGVSLYQQALADDPANALLMYKLAMAYDKTHDLIHEQAMLEQSIQLAPNLAEAQNQIGYLAVHRGQTAQAEDHFRSAIHAAPSYTIAWINLAASYASEARWQEAKDAVGHALAIDPSNAMAQKLSQAISAASPGTP